MPQIHSSAANSNSGIKYIEVDKSLFLNRGIHISRHQSSFWVAGARSKDTPYGTCIWRTVI